MSELLSTLGGQRIWLEDGRSLTVAEAVKEGLAVLKEQTIDAEMQLEGDMGFSSWLSTPSRDLSAERIPVMAWEKYFQMYVRNPIVLFHHKHDTPCGHTKNPRLITEGTDTGFYLEGVTLAPTSFNKEFLWPLIHHGSLRQMSVGFLSLSGYKDKATQEYVHTLAYPLEGSVVSIACNPMAMITEHKAYVKQYQEILERSGMTDSLESIYDLVMSGRLSAPSEHHKNFYMGGTDESPVQPPAEEAVEDVSTMKIKATNETKEAGVSFDLAKYYAAKCGDAYILPIRVKGHTKAEGYIPELVMSSFVTFANHYALACDKTDFEAILTAFSKAYRVLGLDAPKVEGKSVFGIGQEELKASEIEYVNNETYHYKVITAIMAVKEALSAKTGVTEKFTWVSFDIWVSPDNPEDAAMITDLLSVLYPAGQDSDETGVPPMPAVVEDAVKAAEDEDQEEIPVVTEVVEAVTPAEEDELEVKQLNLSVQEQAHIKAVLKF